MRNTVSILVTVILIGLLLAAATPAFREAQLRENLARAHSDLSSLAAAVEAYRVDHSAYPGDGSQYCWGYPSAPYDYYWYLPNTLTTPVAYVSSNMIQDPFREELTGWSPAFKRYRYRYVDMTWGLAGTRTLPSSYYPFLKDWYGSWVLSASGPDTLFGPYYPTDSYPGTSYPSLTLPYDPTNGLFSTGDIERAQKIYPYLR